VKPVDPACFSQPSVRCVHRSRRRHVPLLSGLCPKDRPMLSTPQRKNPSPHSEPFGPFWRPKGLRILGRQALHPLPRPAGRSVSPEPVWDRPAGTPNTLAPNRWKLGQLGYARQELVRVPESNTKYGGTRGKTGGGHPPV